MAGGAPQVANADFFLKMVPLFDDGDDVGMVLSPQAYHNVDIRCDVFNHSNVQFWEYAQPGYDALPFISCTGAPCCVTRVCRVHSWAPPLPAGARQPAGCRLLSALHPLQCVV